jgi:hypothetical protein
VLLGIQNDDVDYEKKTEIFLSRGYFVLVFLSRHAHPTIQYSFFHFLLSAMADLRNPLFSLIFIFILSEGVLKNVPRNRGNPRQSTRQRSTCLHLRIPKGIRCLACDTHYDYLITNPTKKRGVGPKAICEFPWADVFETHKDCVKINRFHQAWAHINNDADVEEAIEEETPKTPKKRKTIAASGLFSTTSSVAAGSLFIILYRRSHYYIIILSTMQVSVRPYVFV